jgi:hemoglobin
MTSDQEIFGRIGADGFDRLTKAFYAGVMTDDILGPMYPHDDMTGAQERLRDFLIQRFGGPTTYSDQRGHPRLRMRHAPFAVDEAARDRWLALMKSALDQCAFDEDVRAMLWPYFVSTALHMQNRG